jgi:transcriptional regulator GlxA family with amidase domain
MRQNYRRQLSLDRTASSVGVSRWHLSRILMAYTGRGFRQTLSAIRAEQAAGLLLTSAHSMKQIAWMVGYKHVSTFDREFRTYYAASPTAFKHAALCGKAEGLSADAIEDATSHGLRSPGHSGQEE